ncbi:MULTISPECIES: GPO family capsid scaffolding protein [Pseudomonas]|uniref:GPO family capsid scaffolding protein n=1 Tax=Pseudomonas TaxID=286 RepID=UPI001C7EB2F3|nr:MULTISPECIES: GPO family capsid scaffolding protein [Pseudomonas]MDH0894705.1 GPO family capsid scaffolding protein [Pseudomonas sp. GD03875]MDH1065226.1 GPO family capsid scaffolding protein [Pseudomonas sp. GD03985]
MAASTAPAKKYRSKPFRVALEGATTDGRNIERSWIEEMASSYDRNLYGARINCEHIKSVMPESPFGAYGDVVALKAEEVELGGKKKLALYAQFEPNEAGIALNKKGQKIYTSIEVSPKFADTGKAYLVGVALTDNPASLGTEALAFSAQHGTLNSRKVSPENLFTSAEQVEAIEFEEITDTPSMFAGLKEKLDGLLGKSKDKEGKDAASFAALGEMIEQIATHGAEQEKAFATEQAARKALQTKFETLQTEFADLVKRLSNTPNPSQPKRPVASGGDGLAVTDC